MARCVALAVAGLLATSVVTLFPDDADARRRIHRAPGPKVAHAVRSRMGLGDDPRTNPRFSSIVVDVKAGRALYGVDPDGLRHPASVTKVMTLYMLFEQLEAGRLTLDSQLPVSGYASAQAPTKLGLRPGSSLRVEDAIMGMVTRSANDAAVVVAEAIGGSEANFAAMMTRKARSLGMTRTVYRNASGLPNPGQITTARDLAVLGVAIQDRFPRYYRYFSTRTFVYRGQPIANHNRLVGSVEGVDGIKTGYTNASGFNLLTSVRREGRQLVAVVMGGRSGASRDATMRQMIADYLPRAFAGSRKGEPVYASLETKPAAPVAPAAKVVPSAPVEASVAAIPVPAPARIRPAVVAEAARLDTPAPVAAPIRLASAASASLPVGALAAVRPGAPPARPAVAAVEPPAPAMRWVEGAPPVATAPATRPTRAVAEDADAPATTATVQSVRTTTIRLDTASEAAPDAPEDETAPAPADATPARPAEPAAHSGWIIQIGATDSADAAQKLLARAKATGHGALADAQGFTESVEKNGSTLWRARFAGFEGQREAQAACAALKSRAFSCLPVRL